MPIIKSSWEGGRVQNSFPSYKHKQSRYLSEDVSKGLNMQTKEKESVSYFRFELKPSDWFVVHVGVAHNSAICYISSTTEHFHSSLG